MNYGDILSILELVLLAAVFVFLFRFIFLNYSSKVRKPHAWVKAVKDGKVSPELMAAEKKYSDRIRFYNIWMQINRLLDDKIPGDFAELGVYKGNTARVIHHCVPDRKLYLFDTFEGFPQEDLKAETGNASGYTSSHFSDTSIEKVKSRLGDSPNIFIRKGYFPDTADELKETKFAFVSMDADLHNPTLAGLEFFYPRLSEGGIILIHDYNTDWPELMKAVDDFAASISEPLLPVPDADSTIMIVKSKA